MVTAWVILSSAIPHNQSSTAFKDNTYYYWYLADDDSYDAYSTISAEISHLETLYGTYVDTSPFGGTLVARGYNSNVYPHTVWPSSLLYAHF